MKILIFTFALLFSTALFPTSSQAEWTKVGTSGGGANTFYYVDLGRVRHHGGYVYWWDMSDYLKPVDNVMSAKAYNQGDCGAFRYKILSLSVSAEPISGSGLYYSKSFPVEWQFPPPNDINEIILNLVCNK